MSDLIIKPANDLLNGQRVLKPSEAQMAISVRDNLVVVEMGEGWFCLNKWQAIKFVQAIADAANRLV